MRTVPKGYVLPGGGQRLVARGRRCEVLHIGEDEIGGKSRAFGLLGYHYC